MNKSQILDLITKSLMIEKYISVQIIGKKHLFLKYFWNSPMFFRWNDLHPFLQTLPLPEHDEKIISTNLVKCLHLLKPLLHWNKFSGLWIYKSTHTFATECVVVLYLLVYYLWVRHHLHVIVIVLVLVLLNHVYELVSCQLFLTDHLEKCCHLTVWYLDIVSVTLLNWNRWRYCWRYGLHFYTTWHLGRCLPHWQTLPNIFNLLVGKRVAPTSSSGRYHARINRRDILMNRRSFGPSKQRQYFFGFLFLEGFLLSLLYRDMMIHKREDWFPAQV